MPPRPIGLAGLVAVVRRIILLLEADGQLDEAQRLDSWLAPFRSPWAGGEQDVAVRELARELRRLAGDPSLSPEAAAEVAYALRSHLLE